MNGKIDSNLLGSFAIDGVSGGSNLKSPIQSGSVSFASGDTSKTVTISPVTMGKCLVYRSNIPLGATTGVDNFIIVLTNSTTLTINRTFTGTAETVNWTAEEYNNVKSFQSGSVTPASDNQNVTADRKR